MNKHLAEAIAARLKYLREQAGMTQVEAAVASSVGSKTISSYETTIRVHRMPLHALHKLCRVYGVTLAEFFNIASIMRAESPMRDGEITVNPRLMPYENYFAKKGLLR